MQRRMQAWIHHKPYRERYTFVPLNQISPDFQHAVIAAELGCDATILSRINPINKGMGEFPVHSATVWRW